jgi:hypothetical protein
MASYLGCAAPAEHNAGYFGDLREFRNIALPYDPGPRIGTAIDLEP